MQERIVRPQAPHPHSLVYYKQRKQARGLCVALNSLRNSSTTLSIDVIRPLKGSDPAQPPEGSEKYVSKYYGVETASCKIQIREPEEKQCRSSALLTSCQNVMKANVHASSEESVPTARGKHEGKALGRRSDGTKGVREVMRESVYRYLILTRPS